MEKVKRLDSFAQMKLTQSIQKAASKALSSNQDRSQILATQLDKDGIPKQFTKTASAAFNRRIAVVTLGKRNEQTKADDFPLADFNKVAQLRGCQDMTKKASVTSGDFIFTVEKPVMQKTASVIPFRQPVKELSIQQVMNKLASFIQRQTLKFEEDLHKLAAEKNILQSMLKKASNMLAKDQKTAQQLATVYGDTYTSLFTDKVPQKCLKKYAAYTILPKTLTVQYVQNTIKQSDSVKLRTNVLLAKQAYLKEVASEAAELDKAFHQAQMKGLVKKADGYSFAKDILANMVSVPLTTAGRAAQGAVNITQDQVQRVAQLLSKSYAVSPSSAITGPLMNADRYDDKVMRLTDMLADEDLASYRAQDIEQVVQDVLIQHPEFVSPRFKQHLKTAVKNRLLAGGKVDAATQAAQATTLKSLSDADLKRSQRSQEKRVAQLKDKQTSEKSVLDIVPDLSSIANILGQGKIVDTSNSFNSWMQSIRASRQKDQQIKEKMSAGITDSLRAHQQARDKLLRGRMLSALRHKGEFGGTSLSDILKDKNNKYHALAEAINNARTKRYEMQLSGLSLDNLRALQDLEAPSISDMSDQQVQQQLVMLGLGGKGNSK